MAEPKLDPYKLLAALERHRVTYIVIGSIARIVHGADEITNGIDIVPAMREENLRRLGEALDDLNARRRDGGELVVSDATLVREPVVDLVTDWGGLKIVPTPEGTRGFDDLRRVVSREYIGKGLRPTFASTGDLARMLSAMAREQDIPRLMQMRRLMELESGLSLGL